jgi:hypothetical protein
MIRDFLHVTPHWQLEREDGIDNMPMPVSEIPAGPYAGA